MDLFQNASDDQIALMGCAAALLLSGGLMYVSYFLGQGRAQAGKQSETLPFPESKSQPDSSRRVA